MQKKITPAKLTIAIQGYAGSFHQQAADFWAAGKYKLLPQETFTEVFAAVESGTADLGLAAVENTLIGSIGETLDGLLKHDVHVVGEVVLHIHHQLYGVPGSDLKIIKIVQSQTQALEQCKTFLKELGKIEIKHTADTALSVDQMMQGRDASVASIAGSLAGKRYGAVELAHNIETDVENYTRFLVLGKKIQKINSAPILSQTQPIKTSLAVLVKHEPGSLAHCLQALAKLSCNLTKIESRPIIGQPWQYAIYLDMEHALGVTSSKDIAAVLKPYSTDVKIFGTFNKGVVYET